MSDPNGPDSSGHPVDEVVPKPRTEAKPDSSGHPVDEVVPPTGGTKPASSGHPVDEIVKPDVD